MRAGDLALRPRRLAGQHDDPAPAPRPQRRQAGLGDQEGAGQVHRQHPAPFLGRHVADLARRGHPAPWARCRHCSRRCRAAANRSPSTIGRAATACSSATSSRMARASCPAARSAAAVASTSSITSASTTGWPLRGQLRGDAGADAAGGAGDQGDAVLRRGHGVRITLRGGALAGELEPLDPALERHAVGDHRAEALRVAGQLRQHAVPGAALGAVAGAELVAHADEIGQRQRQRRGMDAGGDDDAALLQHRQPSFRVCGTPVASSTTSTARPPVSARTWSFSGASATSTISVKPSARSTSKRGASARPATITRAAPASRANRAMAWPMVPGPSTSTVSPRPTSPVSTASAPTPSGSVSAASSASRPSGMATQQREGTRTSAWKPPSRVRPMPCRPGSCASPARQLAQWPQKTKGITATRSPSAKPEPVPLRMMVPANSWPMVSGRCGTMKS